MAPLYNVLSIFIILSNAWVPITSASLTGAWDIKTGNDPNSCEAHMAELQTTYDESGVMVQAARDMIDLIRNNRKQLTRASAPEVADWNRGARLFTAIFGVKFDPSRGPANTFQFNSVSNVYNQMSDVFAPNQDNEPPQPAISYTGKFEKPAIACGDGGWVFIDVDGEDLGDPAKRKLSESKQGSDGSPRYPRGVWFWNMRYFMGPTSTPQSVGICGHNINAITQVQLDMITLCDVVWGNPTLQQGKDSAHQDETTLDEITKNAPSRTLVHEFAHYFGFGGFGNPTPQTIDDVQAVNREGRPLWVTADGSARTVNRPPGPARPAKTYFMNDCVNLAKNAPDRAVSTAETYAYFAAGMFANNFDWSLDHAQSIPGLTTKRAVPFHG